jgi:hypothetical protein
MTHNRRELWFMAWGVLLWLAATLAFHLWGQWIIDAGRPAVTVVSFAAAVPCILVCTLPLYRKLDVADADRLRAAVCIALPGMLLDAVSLPLHRTVFPGITGESVPLLAAWLLWAYGLILATGLAATRRAAP